MEEGFPPAAVESSSQSAPIARRGAMIGKLMALAGGVTDACGAFSDLELGVWWLERRFVG